MKLFTKFLFFSFVLGCISLSVFATGTTEKKSTMSESQNTNKIQLVVTASTAGQELELITEGCQKYMQEHPNIDAKILTVPSDSTDRLGLFMQYFETQSNAVDIFLIDGIWPGDIAEHLLPLGPYGAEKYTKDMFPSMIQNDTVNGKLLAMPAYTDAGVLYYRTDLMKKYGFTQPPQTWAELKTMAETVQKGERAAGNQDFWGFVWQGNAYEGLTCDALEWIYSEGGGSIVESDGTISIDNTHAAKALDRAASWINTICPEGVLGYTEEESRAIFQAGNAMFMRNWPYCYSLGNTEGSMIKGKFDVTTLPKGASGHGAAALGGWQLAASQYSDHPEEAAKLVFFLTGYEQQKMRAIKGSFEPTIASLYKDPEVLAAVPFFSNMLDVFNTSCARPSTVTAPHYAEVSKVFYSEVHDVLLGKENGKTAVENITLNIEDII